MIMSATTTRKTSFLTNLFSRGDPNIKRKEVKLGAKKELLGDKVEEFKVQDLIIAGKMAQHLKSSITYYVEDPAPSFLDLRPEEVRYWLEENIADTIFYGKEFNLLFPVNVCPGKILSHRAPDSLPLDPTLQSKELKLKDYDYITIDFGFYNQTSKVDTAITICTSEESKAYLERYRKNVQLVLRLLKEQYQRQGYLLKEDISRAVTLNFTNFKVVYECGSHTITPTTLHGQFISMDATKGISKGRLEKGTLFTLEPHVVVKGANYKLNFVPGHIRKVEGNPQRFEYVKEVSEDNYAEIHCSNNGFYQENLIYLAEVDGKPQFKVLC